MVSYPTKQHTHRQQYRPAYLASARRAGRNFNAYLYTFTLTVRYPVLPCQPAQSRAKKTRTVSPKCLSGKENPTIQQFGLGFSRLILDLNRASEAAGRSIGELRHIAASLKAVFLAFCT